jgi:Ser/Thr protein kinase RdoA (MazF antagonist)
MWDESGAPGLIDFDNACAADRATDVAPLIGFYGAAKVREIVDADLRVSCILMDAVLCSLVK